MNKDILKIIAFSLLISGAAFACGVLLFFFIQAARDVYHRLEAARALI